MTDEKIQSMRDRDVFWQGYEAGRASYAESPVPDSTVDAFRLGWDTALALADAARETENVELGLLRDENARLRFRLSQMED